MGRAKLNMELISKEKSRNITFKKRKEGLMRKMHEFTTLCDVSACMIIYPPKQDKEIVEPEIWPPNLEETRRIIDIYKNKNRDSGNKTFGLNDFFHDRKRKIEEELSKLRKKNMEAKYPCSSKILEQLNESQLREFYTFLSNKAEYVRSRIEMLKQNNHNANVVDFGHGRLTQRGRELDMMMNQQAIEMHLPIHYPSVNDHQNPMMMLLMNDSDYVQFGGGSGGGGGGGGGGVGGGGGAGGLSSGNIQCAAFKRQVVYESTASIGGPPMVDNAMYHNPMQLTRYYAMAPPVLPNVPPPYMPPAMMPGIGPLPQVNSLKEINEQDEVFHYPFKNQRARYYD